MIDYSEELSTDVEGMILIPCPTRLLSMSCLAALDLTLRGTCNILGSAASVAVGPVMLMPQRVLLDTAPMYRKLALASARYWKEE